MPYALIKSPTAVWFCASQKNKEVQIPVCVTKATVNQTAAAFWNPSAGGTVVSVGNRRNIAEKHVRTSSGIERPR